MSVINLDLQRKVKYKLRRCHESEINDKGIFEGRTYKDFQELLKLHPDIPVVEMDTVKAVLDRLEKKLGTFVFCSLRQQEPA